MLGDELKKSLEPIQASDELLEKTRRAIEQARLQQASATLAEKSAPKKNAARRSMFLRAVVPIACVLLLGFGIYFIIPKGGKDSMSKSGKKSPLKEHNSDIAEITADIDKVIDSDEQDFYETTEAGDDVQESYDSTQVAAEETTTEPMQTTDKKGDNNKQITLNPALHGDAIDGIVPDAAEAEYVVSGDYILSVSADKKSLVIQDAQTKQILASNRDHEVPELDLEWDETIYSLYYAEKSNTLYIVTLVSEHPETDFEAKCHVYYCTYKDGKVIGDQPVKLGD